MKSHDSCIHHAAVRLLVCRFFWLAALLGASTSWADPVWHCSRQGASLNANAISQDDQFFIASMSNPQEVIGVSIRDLMDVYSGVPVKVGGQVLSACFRSANDADTAPALKALGLQASAIQALARKSNIVQSHLYVVADESSMQSCIGKHFPAVGYLSKPTETQHLMPCF